MLQGSQSGVYSNTRSGWHSVGKREEIKDHIAELKVIVLHILEHVHDGRAEHIQEIHHHMDELDKEVVLFHDSATFAANKWKRFDLHRFCVATFVIIISFRCIPVCVISDLVHFQLHKWEILFL